MYALIHIAVGVCRLLLPHAPYYCAPNFSCAPWRRERPAHPFHGVGGKEPSLSVLCGCPPMDADGVLRGDGVQSKHGHSAVKVATVVGAADMDFREGAPHRAHCSVQGAAKVPKVSEGTVRGCLRSDLACF